MTVLQPSRPGVLWFGDQPDDQTVREYRTRGLRLKPWKGELTTQLLASARGAVFSLSEYALADALRLMNTSVLHLADHGLYVCIGFHDGSDRALVGFTEAPVSKLLNERWARIGAGLEPYEFAERIARHDPGPSASPAFQPEFPPNPVPLSSEDHLLLSRCFGACGQVRMEDMDSGLSSARVLRVDATAHNSFGSWAQPRFAKLDRADKILREAAKYRDAAPFIPFALRPQVEYVVVGAQRGVLVGNLVDHPEPLWDVVRRRGAEPVLTSLFNDTLGGWRGIAQQAGVVSGPVLIALEQAGVLSRSRLDVSAVAQDARDQGGLPVDEIFSILGGLRQTFYRGPIHGDLHAENVLVRNRDAVLIDLALSGEGPIVADMALLEAWLSFAVHRNDKKDQYLDPEWRQTVGHLYEPQAFRNAPPPSNATTGSRWLWDAVRQLRMMGCSTQSCPTEYQVGVICAMLRMCMFEPRSKAERGRRVTAYLLASNLTRELASEPSVYAC